MIINHDQNFLVNTLGDSPYTKMVWREYERLTYVCTSWGPSDYSDRNFNSKWLKEKGNRPVHVTLPRVASEGIHSVV